MTDSQIIIIGGGISGLRAAVALTKREIPFILLEKEDSLGGRIRTDQIDEFLLDRGFQVLLPAYEEAKEIFDYKALNLKPFQKGAKIYLDGKWHTVRDPFQAPFQALLSVASPIGSLKDKILTAHYQMRALQGNLNGNPEDSTIEYLKKAGLSEKIIENFYRPFFSGVFLEKDLNSPSTSFAYLFRMFAEEGAALPANGMESLVKQLESKVSPESIHTGVSVESVNENVVTLEGGEKIAGSKIILAVEERSAKKLLCLPAETHSRGTTCFYLSIKDSKKIPPILHLFPLSESGITNLAPVSAVAPAYSTGDTQLISVSATHNENEGKDFSEAAIIAEVATTLGISKDKFDLVKRYEIPNALPSIEPFPAELPLSEHILLAGDVSNHSSINGALRAGRLAAESVV